MRLVVIEVPGLPAGMQQRQEFDLRPDPARPKWIIGRQMGSDIHLIDPSVSRTHAEVSLHPDGLLVRDLGSANGTFVNERPMLPLSPTLLRPGERLRLGNVVTLLEGGPVGDHYNAATTLNAPRPGYSPAPNPVQGQSPRNQMPQTTPLGQSQPQVQAPRPVQPAPSAPAPVSYNNPAPPANPGLPPVPSFNIDPPSNAYRPLQPQSSAPQARYDSAGYRYDYVPEQPYQKPAAKPYSKGKLTPLPKSKRGPRWGIILTLVLLLLVALGVGGYFYYTLVLNPTTNLPGAVFRSPANNEQILGINVSRPSGWTRNDPTPSQILFFRPENSKTVLNIEQPPSPSIVDASYTPDKAVKQYVANVKSNASKVQVETEPASTKLKDGTPATLTRLVFSTDGAKATQVTDYHMLAISFRCGNQLYFVSAAAEDKDYATNKQDLDASIANLTCFAGQG